MKKITILLGIVLLIFMGLPAKEASAADTDYKSVVSDLFFEDEEDDDYWEYIDDPEELIRMAENVKELLELGNDYKIRWADSEPDRGYYIYWSAVTDKARSTELETGVDPKGHIFCAFFLDLRAENEKDRTVLGTRKELQKNAEEIIYRLIPGSYGHIEKTPDDTYSKYEDDHLYEYEFTRIENGFEAPAFIHVEICKNDGKLASVDIEWDYDVDFPAPEKTISAGKAWKKFKKKAAVSLHYDVKINSVYDENKGKYTYIGQVYPMYWPKYHTIDIDAVTGKVSVEKTGYDSHPVYDPYDDDMYLGKKVNPKKVSRDILSEDEAFDLVLSNEYLMTFPDLPNKSATLYKLNENYFWLLNMRSDPVLNARGYYTYGPEAEYFTAVVNAATGELDYYSSTGGRKGRSADEIRDVAKFSKKECKKIFRKFLKRAFPKVYESSEYYETMSAVCYGYDFKDITTHYSVSYMRFCNDIPFDNNGAEGIIDRETGKITDFYKTWTDLEIPAPENLIPEDEAIEVMYGGKRMKPVYVIDYNTDEYGNIFSKSVRLVYEYDLYMHDLRADRVSTEK